MMCHWCFKWCRRDGLSVRTAITAARRCSKDKHYSERSGERLHYGPTVFVWVFRERR